MFGIHEQEERDFCPSSDFEVATNMAMREHQENPQVQENRRLIKEALNKGLYVVVVVYPIYNGFDAIIGNSLLFSGAFFLKKDALDYLNHQYDDYEDDETFLKILEPTLQQLVDRYGEYNAHN